MKLSRIDQTFLKKIAPFSLFNLFEDARIEHKYRATYGHRFEWLKFEDHKVSAQPTSILFALIQAEGDRAVVESILDRVKVSDDLIDNVEGFYQRAIEAEHSHALYPVILDWVSLFGRPPESAGLEDLSLSLELQGNPEAFDAFDSDSVSLSERGSASGGGFGGPGSEEVSKIEGNADLLSEYPSTVCTDRALRVASRLERLFVTEARMVSSEVPSKRISIRNYVAGKPFYRRPEVKARKRRQVLLVVDCSGSMSGHHIQEGRILVAALSELALRGVVSGHVVLSAVQQGRACWQRFKLPMPLEAVERIGAFGQAEGLDFSLQANFDVARDSDYVFVYTDGQICDAPINKRAWHARGVFTWGLYAGEGQDIMLRALMRYFDKALIRADAERLVEAMLVQRP